MLHCVNPFISMYKTAREQLRKANNDQIRIVITPQLQLILKDQTDHHQYNLSTTEEVAVIIPEETDRPTHHDICLTNRGVGGFQHISQNHPSYMPFHYTLLFSYDNPGWHWGLRLQSTNKEPDQDNQSSCLHQRSYYRYHLHTRQDQSFLIIHLAEQLFQQYVCDVFAVVDQNKLDWLCDHQQNI